VAIEVFCLIKKKMKMDNRPTLNNEISTKDFQEFYWLKEELVSYCRAEGLKTTGGKIEISKRIENYLETGLKNLKQSPKKIKPKSKFDWKKEVLSLETEITDNYKSTENVRKFFQNEIGENFKFNVKFMNWMKSNCGKTLKDAIAEWRQIHSEIKDKTKSKIIAPQFEYNTYLRDFLADNPYAKRELGIKLWKIKRSIRGDNKYRKDDLKMIE